MPSFSPTTWPGTATTAFIIREINRQRALEAYF